MKTLHELASEKKRKDAEQLRKSNKIAIRILICVVIILILVILHIAIVVKELV